MKYPNLFGNNSVIKIISFFTASVAYFGMALSTNIYVYILCVVFNLFGFFRFAYIHYSLIQTIFSNRRKKVYSVVDADAEREIMFWSWAVTLFLLLLFVTLVALRFEFWGKYL